MIVCEDRLRNDLYCVGGPIAPTLMMDRSSFCWLRASADDETAFHETSSFGTGETTRKRWALRVVLIGLRGKPRPVQFRFRFQEFVACIASYQIQAQAIGPIYFSVLSKVFILALSAPTLRRGISAVMYLFSFTKRPIDKCIRFFRHVRTVCN